ncbi:MAG: DUF4097 domain-containing protein [Clostridiales bacterium]|jgi:hypothetical protein|nr:DUF4097 domain-containing protein [Clostridiales bacterium]
MKKIVLIMVAVFLTALTVCLVGAVVAFSDASPLNIEERSFSEFDSAITALEINSNGRAVDVISVKSGFKVDYIVYNGSAVIVGFEDGKLKITASDAEKKADLSYFADRIRLQRLDVDTVVKVYLPETVADVKINVKNADFSYFNVKSTTFAAVIEGGGSFINTVTATDFSVTAKDGSLKTNTINATNFRLNMANGIYYSRAINCTTAEADFKNVMGELSLKGALKTVNVKIKDGSVEVGIDGVMDEFNFSVFLEKGGYSNATDKTGTTDKSIRFYVAGGSLELSFTK